MTRESVYFYSGMARVKTEQKKRAIEVVAEEEEKL